MGLIKAGFESVSSTLGDQFKEFVTCPVMDAKCIVVKGLVQHGEGNKNATDGVISNGSKIAVPQGTAMMIVDNGKIIEFTAEPGEYKFDTSTESSIFEGGFFKGLGSAIKTAASRFASGGQASKNQYVYYLNTKQILGNKFGSPQPKKITDVIYQMIEVTFFGSYSVRVVDPLVLVENVIGSNAKDELRYDDVFNEQTKMEFVEQITRALTEVMRKHKVSFGDIGMYGSAISDELNNCMDVSWRSQYGLEIMDVAVADINLTDASMEKVNKIDEAKMFSDPGLQSGLLASASAEAMKTAAGNENGAMMGFMGMGMAQNQAGTMMGAVNNAGTVHTPNTNQPDANTLFGNISQPAQPVVSSLSSSACENCGTNVEGKFCTECGTAKVIEVFCANCGSKVSGKFCTECGTKA